MEELKTCPFCGKPLYIKVKRYTKPLLMPATRAGALRDELMDITGEEYIQIKANYCPVCGQSLTRRATPENKRLIDAAVLTEEIQHLQIFIGGESLFTPAIKETVLRTIDEQPTVGASPENKPLTLEQLRQMDEEPVYVAPIDKNADWGKHWSIMRPDSVTAMSISEKKRMYFLYAKDYGKTWIAYAHKPEEESN